MPFTDYLLYKLARRWPSPMAKKNQQMGAEPGTDEYNMVYARDQFNRRVRDGIGIKVMGLDVLEVGCGHGGISCFLACAGAKSTVGIDLNVQHLEIARRLSEEIGRQFHGQLPVTFREMNAYHLTFEPNSFDVVVAENSFEHFDDPEEVMRQSHGVLRQGGMLLVPIFSSIYSKYGLHLKQGLKLPWANLAFSERTIIRAMYRLAEERPELRELYPGLKGNPERVRDLRPHRDLNDITYKSFRRMADRTGYDVKGFRYFPTRVGRILQHGPFRSSFLMDVFSTGAGAQLVKR